MKKEIEALLSDFADDLDFEEYRYLSETTADKIISLIEKEIDSSIDDIIDYFGEGFLDVGADKVTDNVLREIINIIKSKLKG